MPPCPETSNLLVQENWLDANAMRASPHQTPVQPRDIRFGCRTFIHGCFPYREPTADKLINGFWVRTNGLQTLYIQGGLHGIPYGIYPRLFMIWLTSEVIRTRSRTISLGKSFREHCKALGVPYSAGKRGTARALQIQIERLLQCRVLRTETSSPGRQTTDITDTALLHETTLNLTVASRTASLWRRLPPEAQDRWHCDRYTLEVSDAFFEEITTQSIPIRHDALMALRRRPMAIDVYQWLAYRYFSLHAPTTPTWDQLANQFGSDYKTLRKFRKKFIETLARVREVYPEANCHPNKTGVTLFPSDTPVPPQERSTFSIPVFGSSEPHSAGKKKSYSQNWP